MIFRAEAEMRKRALASQAEAEANSSKAVSAMNVLEQRIENLEKDKAKAKQLSLKAIAARSNIKQYLDEEKARNGTLQNQIAMIQNKLAEADEEKMEFQNKHDEMFNSVSALNQRIEELESHKL